VACTVTSTDVTGRPRSEERPDLLTAFSPPFHSTNQLHFGPEFLGRVRLVTSAASLAGVSLFNTSLKEVPLRQIFKWTTLIGCALGMTQLLLVTGTNRTLGIDDQWFAMGDSLVLTVLGQVRRNGGFG
jgi:hypothetical protein